MRLTLWTTIGLLALAGCSTEKVDNLLLTTQAALETSLDGVQYDISCTSQDGDGNPVVAQILEYVPFHQGDAPAWLLADGAGDDHSFADLFTTVDAPATCTVTATAGYYDAATDLFTAEALCATAQETVSILEGETSEVVMVLQCQGDVNGGGDFVTVINEGPGIEIVELDKFVCVNESRTLTAQVTDPENDGVSCVWTAEGPGAAVLTPALTDNDTGHTTAFSADNAGEYTVTVSCTDALGGVTAFEFPMHVMICDDTVVIWEDEVTINGPDECDVEPILAVPLSNRNEIAVFDISSVPPAAPPLLTIFDTCQNPSRIMVDGAGDVLVTCRNDGKIQKHSRDGILIWSTQLPACGQARGVAVSPMGRLYAACSFDAGGLFEIDPATGAILDQSSTLAVYGISVDETGIYACHYWNATVAKYDFNLDLVWSTARGCYGIAADGNGGVWVGNTNAAMLNGATGAVENVSTIPDFANGVIVSPKDGTVHLGMEDGGNRVVVLDPTTNPPTILKDYNFSTWSTLYGENMVGPRGTTVDANGTIYALNRQSQNLTWIDMTDDSHMQFGDADIPDDSWPYGYSSDWTGVFKCNSGPVVTWESTPAVLAGTVNWDWIRWYTDTPEGTNIELYYQLDDGPGWTFLTNTRDNNESGVAVIDPPKPGQTIRVKAQLTSWNYPAVKPTLHNLTAHYFVTP